MKETSGFDRLIDGVDNFLVKLDRTLHGEKKQDEKPRRVERTGQVQSASKRKSAGARSTPSTSTALAARHFRIDEVTDATSGAVIFIVTDGATARCEFSSRSTAEKILAQLESSP